MNKSLLQFPFYIFFLGAYPMMALFATNISQIADDAFVRGLIFSLIGMAILYALILIIVRNRHRAGLIASALAVIFFSYGHIATALSDQKIEVSSSVLLIASALIALISVIGLSILKQPERSTSPLNLITLVLLVFPIYQIISSDVQSAMALSDKRQQASLSISVDTQRPDIYYIILDSYGRSDLLLDTYDYDNSHFIRRLEAMDFVVMPCSQSNYQRTELAIGSTLNMDYLQEMDPSFNGKDNMGTYLLWEKIKHSKVRSYLESAGYTFVTYATGFDWLELKDADYYIEPPAINSQITAFETLFLRTTLVREAETRGLLDLSEDEAQQYRDRTLTALNSYDQLQQIQSPKFVYMHIVNPHPPFVFDPNGNPIDAKSFMNEDGKYSPSNYMSGYVLQAEFVSMRAADLIHKILDNSRITPIIIIQGDHAPWISNEHRKFEILNAYLLPGHSDAVYPEISPVNSFRVILNAYFGEQFPLLEDKSFYSPAPYAFDFHPVQTFCPDSGKENK